MQSKNEEKQNLGSDNKEDGEFFYYFNGAVKEKLLIREKSTSFIFRKMKLNDNNRWIYFFNSIVEIRPTN